MTPQTLFGLALAALCLSCMPGHNASESPIPTPSIGDNSGPRFDSQPAVDCYRSSRNARLRRFYERPSPANIPPPLAGRYDAPPPNISADDRAVWIAADRNRRGDEAGYFRYVYLSNDLIANPLSANAARLGLVKGLNSTAIYADSLYVPEDISPNIGAVYAVDTRALWGQVDQGDGPSAWNCIAGPLNGDGRVRLSPGVISNGRMALNNFANDQPVHVARVVYNALHPDVYNELIDTPSNQSGLMRDLGIEQVTMDSVLAWTAQADAIVFGPRVSKLIRSIDNRNYWATQDYFVGGEGDPIPYAVGDPVPVIQSRDGWVELPRQTENGYSTELGDTMASEAWIEMRNGLNAYYIWGNAHQERGRAEKSFVVDPQNNFDGYLVTGRSCITCHTQGVQQGPNEMARLIEQGALPADQIERARQVWTPADTLQSYYSETLVTFKGAMSSLVQSVSDANDSQQQDWINGYGDEPVNFLVNYVESGRLSE